MRELVPGMAFEYFVQGVIQDRCLLALFKDKDVGLVSYGRTRPFRQAVPPVPSLGTLLDSTWPTVMGAVPSTRNHYKNRTGRL